MNGPVHKPSPKAKPRSIAGLSIGGAEVFAQKLRSTTSLLINFLARPLLFGIADLLVTCDGLVLRRRLAMQAALPVNKLNASVKQIYDLINMTLLLL